MTPGAEGRSRATAAPAALRAPGVATAVGPGPGLQDTPRDRSGGRADDGDRRSTATQPVVDKCALLSQRPRTMAGMVRGLAEVLVVSIALAAAVLALATGLVWLGTPLPEWASALSTSAGIVAVGASLLFARSPTLRFWLIRVRTLLRPRTAPQWRLSVGLRVRIGPEQIDLFRERLAKRLPSAAIQPLGSGRFDVSAGGVHLDLGWGEAIVDESRDLMDWQADVLFEAPVVSYRDSIGLLRGSVMPVLERVDEALEAHARHYQLVVSYKPGTSPFEGLLVRSVPSAAIATYDVLLTAGRNEQIHLGKDKLSLESPSRASFEQLVHRFLTLDNDWRADAGLT
jgi:hypothetical protein